MNIGVYYKVLSSETIDVLIRLAKSFKKHNISMLFPQDKYSMVKNSGVILDANVFNESNSLSSHNADYLIAIGGDGTFLEALMTNEHHKVPLIGINTGRLGFLADIMPHEIEKAMDCLVDNKFIIEERTMLQGKSNTITNFSYPYALNEITVHKRDTSSMIVIHAYIDNYFLSTYWADGLIIATPTGSTAYSMSAGGPIIAPNGNSLIITPIASHNLSVRPLIIPDYHEIKLSVESRDRNYLISLDSRSLAVDQPIDLMISKAPNGAKLVKFNNYSYFDTLRNKLLWGIDKRN